jgi:hypothetical protein
MVWVVGSSDFVADVVVYLVLTNAEQGVSTYVTIVSNLPHTAECAARTVTRADYKVSSDLTIVRTGYVDCRPAKLGASIVEAVIENVNLTANLNPTRRGITVTNLVPVRYASITLDIPPQATTHSGPTTDVVAYDTIGAEDQFEHATRLVPVVVAMPVVDPRVVLKAMAGSVQHGQPVDTMLAYQTLFYYATCVSAVVRRPAKADTYAMREGDLAVTKFKPSTIVVADRVAKRARPSVHERDALELHVVSVCKPPVSLFDHVHTVEASSRVGAT